GRKKSVRYGSLRCPNPYLRGGERSARLLCAYGGVANMGTDGRKSTTAQLEQALREKTREVDVLHRISESISNTLDLEAVLRHIVDVVVEVTKADACLLYLLSDARDELILRASKNPHPKLIGRITIGLGEGITGWVA